MTQFLFFSSRRRHTGWNCDWSSDVCSSDLSRYGTTRRSSKKEIGGVERSEYREGCNDFRVEAGVTQVLQKIGRASCRERVQILELAVALKMHEIQFVRVLLDV